MYAGGQSRANGGGADEGGRDALLRRRKHPVPSCFSSASGAVAAGSSSSSSGRAEEEFGGKKRWGRRKKQGKREAMARAIRDGVPAAAASCWRGVSVVEETAVGSGRGRSLSRRRDSAAEGGSIHDGDNSGEEGRSGPTTGTAPAGTAWCCVCPAADCALEPNPSANGKEDPGMRSLLERNDFFSADCNPHADGLASSSSW